MDKKMYLTPEMEEMDLEIGTVLIGVSTDGDNNDWETGEGDAPGF